MSNCQQQEYTKKAFGWAARDCGGILAPFNFNRRATGKDDVTIKVLYCGICHTDLHYIKNDFGISSYPLVPGHEIVGVVTEFGHNVTKVKVGDKVGIGYMIESCQSCESCSKSLENYCPKMITTCNGKYDDGKTAYGGFSDIIVANVRYVVHIPDNLPLDGSAPLLCAGVSVYSPMKYFGLVSEPSMHLGVVGLGGLGHVAVKFAKAFGVKVTVISTSSNKEEEAKRLGADLFLVSHDPEQIKVAMGTMDGIIDTVSAFHPILPLIDLLKSHGKLVMVGAPDRPLELPVFPLLMGRKIVAGSCIGGMKEMQEMIDFAGKHNITADIEVVSLDHLNVAFERLAKGDVKYRFVVDVANTLSTAQP